MELQVFQLTATQRSCILINNHETHVGVGFGADAYVYILARRCADGRFDLHLYEMSLVWVYTIMNMSSTYSIQQILLKMYDLLVVDKLSVDYHIDE